MKPKTITLAIVCAVVMVGLFGPGRLPSSGQETNRLPACGCYVCGKLDAVTFEDEATAKPCAGILAEDACPVELAGMPNDQRDAICQKIKAKLNFTSFKDSCPVFASSCEPKANQPPDPKANKCEPPPPETNNPPWLNPDSPCRDRQRGTISWSQNPASPMDVRFTVSMCGEVLRWTNRGGGSPESNPPGMSSFDVCCDSWRNAADTNSPCDARRDIDCDGYPNESDQTPEYSGRARRSDDFTSQSPLTGLPFWKKLDSAMPPQSGCKDCKWELVRVDYTCKEEFDPMKSASQNRNVFDARYDYQATWKCPSTGQTQVEKETVTMAGMRCPSPPNRSWP